MQLEIWDRRGTLFFTSDDPGTGWDGTSGRKPAPAGSYTYRITLEPQVVLNLTSTRPLVHLPTCLIWNHKDPQRGRCRTTRNRIGLGHLHTARVDDPASEVPGDGKTVFVGDAEAGIAVAAGPGVGMAGHQRGGVGNGLSLGYRAGTGDHRDRGLMDCYILGAGRSATIMISENKSFVNYLEPF